MFELGDAVFYLYLMAGKDNKHPLGLGPGSVNSMTQADWRGSVRCSLAQTCHGELDLISSLDFFVCGWMLHPYWLLLADP